jgi:signal transduction histidine kinase
VVETDVQGSPVARADELRVLQVVRALLDNALTHTPEGTRVTLRAWADREHALIEVEDDGPGIAPEHAAHVFDRFYRGDGTVASGSGLGLAIARELVEMMGGEVVLDTQPGRTVVRVVLGAAPTSVTAEPTASVST